MRHQKPVLILGSAPNAVEASDWDKDLFSTVVVINNAWRVRRDWDYLICPEDFPAAKRPEHVACDQQMVDAKRYVPAINECGGFVYAGGTMAFTAGYWALAELRPSAMIFMGCDMVYDATKPTHFYGTGTADPLRDDITLRNLEAKSARLMAFAARAGCACLRVGKAQSRLVFPQIAVSDLDEVRLEPARLNSDAVRRAVENEEKLGYFVESGRYWEDETPVSTAQIDALDQLWLRTLPKAA